MLKYNQITQLISELLFKHDCVIVPNFGGFVAQSNSSHFSKGNSLLLPPTKQVLFNKNLKHNDGLLISAFSEKFAINYAESIVQVEDYREYLVALLSAKKRFELVNLGLLYIDNDNEIRFEPKTDVNFLIDSFGFEPVIVNEIEQITEPRILSTVFEDRKIKTEFKSVKKTSLKKIAVLTIGFSITMAFLVFAVNSKQMQPIMQSSLNPFYSAPKNYNPLNYKNNQAFYLDKIETPNYITDSNGCAAFKLSENGPALIASVNTFETANANNIVNYSESNLEANYQVVVGCFGVKSNAEKLIIDLKSKNISGFISGVNKKGLFVVSCGGFNAKNEANNLVTKLKSKFPNAWIMSK